MEKVGFELAGDEYTLAMTTNAMAAFEEATGESAISAFQRLEAEPSILLIRNLFRAAVSPSVTAEDAGDLIDGLGFARATELLGEAMKKAFSGLTENPKKPSAT